VDSDDEEAMRKRKKEFQITNYKSGGVYSTHVGVFGELSRGVSLSFVGGRPEEEKRSR
jgi:hypothetical protein